MLEGAERGDALTFAWYTLPVARLLKGYSWMREQSGGVGSIPEGMSPAAALRNRSYGRRHSALKAEVREATTDWAKEKGYLPPYWAILDLARDAVNRR
jgi:hypothetical protein